MVKRTDDAVAVSDGRSVAIIGAGPAGLFAAERLSAQGFKVTVFERMPSPARKFLMAGRGGLNLTHSESLETFLLRYHEPTSLVAQTVRDFPPADLLAWANGLGCETFVGSSGRVFPTALKASPLLRLWLKRLDAQGVVLRTRCTWIGFDADRRPQFQRADGGVETIAADAVLLALGGASWPKLGSDGAWAGILTRHGVAMRTLTASNCGVVIAWSPTLLSKHEGAPVKRVAVSCGESLARGEAIITATGLEGGVVYALSSAIRSALADGTANVTIDLRPDTSLSELQAALAKAPGKESLSNVLRKRARLSPAAQGLLREYGTPPRDPAALAALIKTLPFAVSGMRGIERAISTAGGVAAEALDKDLMLKSLPGVFVAGEMLDFDAPTGGYLLQAAVATGARAATGIARRLAPNDAGAGKEKPAEAAALSSPFQQRLQEGYDFSVC